jgi:NAD(P)-dependent dehydrogenase (short-subunit alcohol dehydrogenase family)
MLSQADSTFRLATRPPPLPPCPSLSYAAHAPHSPSSLFSALAPVVLRAQAPAAKPAILVTGASSGIGRAIAETLSTRGYFVYAGARKPADLAALSAIPNMQGIKLDVTVPGDIAAAVETIRRAGRGLHGVVNNAGVAAAAPLIEMEERELTSLFDVNVFGMFRVTKAFAPLLIESKGRVVNISSISGHSVRSAAGRVQHEQTRGRGVQRCVVRRDGAVRREGQHDRTRQLSLGDRRQHSVTQIQRAVDAHPNSPYQAQMRGMVTAMARYASYPVPSDVAQAAAHALFDANPKMRYMVVPEARQGEVTIRKAIQELVQLNQGHKFTYDRETLLKMLDEALARHR